MKWFLIVCILLGGCGSDMPWAEEDCPDPIVVWEPPPGGEPQPGGEPGEIPLSWDALQPTLEADCLSCHRGDRSFSSEQLFRNSQALNLIRTGEMPKNGVVLSQKSIQAFSAFFLQPVFQPASAKEKNYEEFRAFLVNFDVYD